MKVKIIKLSKQDAFYKDRKKLIGLVGTWEDYLGKGRNNWYGGNFIPDNIPNG